MKSKSPFTFISTFAGIGGFDLGFESAGMVCEAQAEQDKNCLKLLEDKFPRAKRITDIKELHYYGRSVDLISGGFPCQDVSIAGRRAGLAGSRSGLWFEFARALEEFKSRWAVIENVAGLLSSNKGRDFDTILEGLVELGYLVSWRIFDSQYFGIPQRRRRVFIVGSLGSGASAQVLFEPQGLQRNPKKGREEREEDPSGLGEDASGSGRSSRIALGRLAPTLSASGGGTQRPAGQGNELDFLIPDIASTLQTHHARNNKDDTYIAYKIRSGKEGGGKGYLGSDKAFALKGRNDQQIGIRRLTPLECERLQGFPDGWTQAFPDSVRYHMLGNAVSVPVAEWIARRIIQFDQGDNTNE